MVCRLRRYDSGLWWFASILCHPKNVTWKLIKVPFTKNNSIVKRILTVLYTAIPYRDVQGFTGKSLWRQDPCNENRAPCNKKRFFSVKIDLQALQTQTLYSSQGTPCESIPTGKTLFSLQGTPVLIAGVCFHYRDFPVNPCNFPVRDCSVSISAWDT